MLSDGDCMSYSKDLEKNKKWYERQWKVFDIRLHERGKPLIRSIVEDQNCPECGRVMHIKYQTTNGNVYGWLVCSCGFARAIGEIKDY